MCGLKSDTQHEKGMDMARVGDRKAKTLRCAAPAKINLVLRVLERLPNGYHEIWSIMQAVDLTDELTIRVHPDRSGIWIRCTDTRLPTGKSNLVHRAAQRVLDECRCRVGVEIDLVKRIPIGAGLGGGSSDAATVLMGLSGLLGLAWSSETMMRIGGELGSDVPFFIYGACAMIRGWGQEVQPLTLAGERWIVLVTPSFPIRTGWAYAQLAAHRSALVPLSNRLRALEDGRALAWEDLVDLMENDFESVLFVSYPELKDIKLRLQTEGAQVALVSGSGSTVFGVFENKEQAERAAQLFRHSAAHVAVVSTRTSQQTVGHMLHSFTVS